MDNKEKELKTLPIAKLMVRYSLPAIIGMMVNALYNVVDRIFIGNIPNVGSLAMAGLGVTLPMLTILNAFGMLLAVGGATTISLKLGQGKNEETEKVLGNVLALAGLLGILLTIIGITFGTEILTLFGGSPESIPYAQAYINIILAGSAFSLYGSTFSYLIRGDGNPKLSACMMIIGCILNICLDAVFIMGFGFGIEGAALATIISQFTTTTIGFSYYLSGKSQIKLKKSNFKIEIQHFKQILMIGLAPFSMQIASSFTQILSNNMLTEHGGDLAIGAMATIMSVMMMLGMPIVGLSTGMQPIVSYNYGAKEFKRVEEALKLGFIAATVILLAAWLPIILFPEQVVSMFNDDQELLAVTLDGMQKYFLVFPLLGITYIGTNFIQSTGRAKQALFLGLLRQVVLLIPLLYTLPNFFGLNGVWYSQPIADVLSATITVLAVRKTIMEYRREATNEQGDIEPLEVEETPTDTNITDTIQEESNTSV